MSTPNNYQKVNLSKKSNQIDNILSKTIKQMKFNSNLSKMKEYFQSPSWKTLEKTTEGHDLAYSYITDLFKGYKVLFSDGDIILNDKDSLFKDLSSLEKNFINIVNSNPNDTNLYQYGKLNSMYIGTTVSISGSDSYFISELLINTQKYKETYLTTNITYSISETDNTNVNTIVITTTDSKNNNTYVSTIVITNSGTDGTGSSTINYTNGDGRTFNASTIDSSTDSNGTVINTFTFTNGAIITYTPITSTTISADFIIVDSNIKYQITGGNSDAVASFSGSFTGNLITLADPNLTNYSYTLYSGEYNGTFTGRIEYDNNYSSSTTLITNGTDRGISCISSTR